MIEIVWDEKENEEAIRIGNRWKKGGWDWFGLELVKIETDDPEPLRMEHFELPLGMWIVGMLISLLFFIAEIIKHRWAGH